MTKLHITRKSYEFFAALGGKLPSKIVLKSFHNKYLSVESNGRVQAKSENVLAWEIFNVVVVDEGRNKIGLRVRLGGDGEVKYVGAHQNGGWLYAVPRLQGWEQFTVEFLGNNTIALKSFHGKYLGATPTGQLYGAARRQAWETWTFEVAPENQGNFISVE